MSGVVFRGGWRYKLGFYANPVELRPPHRQLPYQRHELSDF